MHLQGLLYATWPSNLFENMFMQLKLIIYYESIFHEKSSGIILYLNQHIFLYINDKNIKV